MSDAVRAIVLAVFILATCIWIGGYVAIGVVARAAAATLDAAPRVAFFRSLGRSYLWVGTPALIVALVTGGVLARNVDWDGLLTVTATMVVILLAGLVVAVLQARRMTRLRHDLLDSPEDRSLSDQVRRGARFATGLRALLGVLSVALVVLGCLLSV